MQFNHQLYLITGENKYLEQIEKTVYNHLIGAENPQTGCVSYYTPLMGKKPYTCFITCCMSSIPRGIAMIPYFTYGRMGNSPSLPLYEPGTYTDTLLMADHKRIGLTLQLQNQFPETAASLLTLQLTEKARFPLVLRVPEWCQSFTATIGPVVYKGIAGKNLVIERNWNVNEQVNINFKMPVLEWAGGKSYPGQIAFQRGPQVLAIDSAVITSSAATIDQVKRIPLKAGGYLKGIQSSLLPATWIGKQVFPVYYSDGTKLILIPFADASQTGGSIKVWLPLKKP
ncbi:MAG TPA: glycoside hydrolase family 127 protein, partial [Chitinophagaceae bacterium]|nr:glycoside hydrolase family 127 protein [Chitinophagaceae bacterium]